MRNVFITVGIVLTTVFVVPCLLVFGVRYIKGMEEESTGVVKSVYQNEVLSMNFKTGSRSLTGVGVGIKNPDLRNKKDIFLAVYALDGSLIRESVVNGNVIPDGEFIKFIFDPIPATFSGEVRFVLSAPTASSSDALQIYLARGNEEPAITPLYQVDSIPGLLISIYSGWFEKLLADRIFAAVYLVTLGSLSIYVLLAKRAR